MAGGALAESTDRFSSTRLASSLMPLAESSATMRSLPVKKIGTGTRASKSPLCGNVFGINGLQNASTSFSLVRRFSPQGRSNSARNATS